MTQGRFLQELFSSIAEHGRRWFEASTQAAVSDEEMEALCRDILSSLGEATGVALAHRILVGFETRDADSKTAFFMMLNTRFGLDPEVVLATAQTYYPGFLRWIVLWLTSQHCFAKNLRGLTST